MKYFFILSIMFVLAATTAKADLRKSLTCTLKNKKQLGLILKIDTKEGWYTITDKKKKEIEKADNTSAEFVRRSNNSVQFNTLNSVEGGLDQILLGVHIETKDGVKQIIAFHHKMKLFYKCE